MRCFAVDGEAEPDACHANQILVGSSVLLAFHDGEPLAWRRGGQDDQVDRRLLGPFAAAALPAIGAAALKAIESGERIIDLP